MRLHLTPVDRRRLALIIATNNPNELDRRCEATHDRADLDWRDWELSQSV